MSTTIPPIQQAPSSSPSKPEASTGLDPEHVFTVKATDATTNQEVKLSYQVLKVGEPNVSYTCSRYYRAPELIFGSTRYTNAIGTSGIDQLVEIIKVLGTPTKDQIRSMNPNYMEHKFPQIKPVALSKLLPRASTEAVNLLTRLLSFDPSSRISACEAMTDPFFDDIKVPGKTLPTGMPLPPLFNFSREELSVRPDLLRRLVPPHVEQQLYDEQHLDLNAFEPVDPSELRVNIE
ncbi:hypothetical protein P7C70_g779, partial [Phenoliferia sp. Uapishka_3]